ncbi:MAG TPA: DNA ligase [Rubrivivax sp.]|nr:DNA ligase [Rubrivivax sp.]
MTACTLTLKRRAFLGGLVSLPAWVQARAAKDAPPLLLAQEAPPSIDPAGWLVSEKYDGVRAIWDGRTLRFRSGAPVAAPAGFIERLPNVPLDGELWLGRGRFEALSGVVRRRVPDEAAWMRVRYMLFELPGAEGTFAARAGRLQQLARRYADPSLVAVEQATLPSAEALQRRLEQVVRDGGEGLVLHRADAPYHTGRSPALLKLKPLHDAEAQVLAHLPGRGRHAQRLGALQVRSEGGTVFALGTGFSDAQRESPPPVGALVSYSHRGFTAEGVPRFASFLRVREF